MSATELKTVPHRIGGRASTGSSGRRGPIFNPATGRQQGEVCLAGRAEVNSAIAAARAAFAAWRETSLTRRSRIMFAFREVIARHAEELARVVSLEHGKVIEDARGEVARGLEVVDFACGIPQLLKGEYSDEVSTGVDSHSFRQPLGVCVGITPFNFPVMVPLWMHPLAIATGNTFVLKPSERDPSASVLMAELYAEAGLPEGVFNVVHGDKLTVDALIAHPDVAAVSFVGSTPVARHVHQQASAHGKRVQALGGAKNHAVVLPDADLEFAASQLVAAAYGSAGQRCMAISVAVAVGDAAEPLVERLAAKARALRVGPGLDAVSDMGPVVTAEARERIAGYIAQAARGGATVVVDGRDLATDGEGFFIGPTLCDRVTTDMQVYRDEVFGPVLVVIRVSTLAAAIALINSNSFANGAAIFTRTGAAARVFQREVEVGMVGVNVPIPVPMAFHSFGGWKSSLFGDVHVHGPEGTRFYTRGKVVTTRWPRDRAAEQAPLHFPVGT